MLASFQFLLNDVCNEVSRSVGSSFFVLLFFYCCWLHRHDRHIKSDLTKRNETTTTNHTETTTTVSRWSMSTRHSTALRPRPPPTRRRRRDLFRWLCSRSPDSCLSLDSTRDKCVEAVAFPVVVIHVLPRNKAAVPAAVVMEIAWRLAKLMCASVFPPRRMSTPALPTMIVVLENAIDSIPPPYAQIRLATRNKTTYN